MKIADDDKLYELLDQWHEDDEYDNILEKIFEIPREQWSNKLWFRVISAYNNKNEFDNANAELSQLRPNCVSAEDVAKWYYMSAYIFYVRDQDVLAKWYLEKSLEYNPQYDGSLELLEEVQEYIDESVKKLELVLRLAEENIERYQKEILEKQELKKCEGGEFAAMLSFPACFGVAPGIPECMGLDFFYKCPTEDNKKETREYLRNRFGITDTESTMQAISRYNCGTEYMDFVSFWNNTPSFDIAQLNEAGLSAFESAKFFGENIRNSLGESGIFAEDINEMMMILRMAYACDILSNTDYCRTALELEDWAREYYHSWKEYVMAAFCGSAYAVYRESCMNLRDTVKFMTKQLALLPYLDCLYYDWEE